MITIKLLLRIQILGLIGRLVRKRLQRIGKFMLFMHLVAMLEIIIGRKQYGPNPFKVMRLHSSRILMGMEQQD